MASNVLFEQSKEGSGDFTLKNVGKFWILKTKKTSKHLVFLDNAKDVTINGNILIADERLFEIQAKENGEYVFRKVEDVSCDTYFSMAGIRRGKIDMEKDMTGKRDKSVLDLDQDKTGSEKPHTEQVYDELDDATIGNATINSDILTKQDQIETFSNVKHVKQAEVYSKGQEEYSPLEFGSTEYYAKHITEIPSETSEGEVFEVEILTTDLVKRCGMKGKMKMSIQDSYISFKDPNTYNEVYKFQLSWIKRYGKNQSLHLFLLEVGRKCPMGSGTILCKTQIADKIQNSVSQRCLEIKRTRTSSNADKS